MPDPRTPSDVVRQGCWCADARKPCTYHEGWLDRHEGIHLPSGDVAIVEGGPLTPEALRAVADWLDTYDRMANVFFDILERKGTHVPEEVGQTISGEGIQNDLRRWAESLAHDAEDKHA